MFAMRYKMLDFKLIIFLIIGMQYSFYAQKTLKNFEGNLTFKESDYYTPISRKIYDTINIYYSYEVEKTIKIERFAPISSFDNDSENKSFLPIIFFKNGDSLFFKYQEKFSTVPDTVISKLFPLSFKDTIDVPFCYRISEDSIRWKDEKRTLEIKTECDGDDRNIKTYRLRDTTITFQDYKIDCYQFEQKSIMSYYKNKFFTRRILLDKITLIPIDVRQYNFRTNRRPRYKSKLTEKNILTFHKKLISIE